MLPLHAGTLNGHADIVKLLIHKGANVNALDDDGDVPIIFASGGGHEEVVKILLEHKADVNAKKKNGWTPLMAAAWNRHSSVVGLLVEAGADINCKTDDGYTALMGASKGGDLSSVKCLVENGADIQTVHSESKFRALHYAACNDHLKVGEYLIEHGATADPVVNTASGLYAAAVISKLLAKRYDDKDDIQNAIQNLTTAGDYYEKASTAYQEEAKQLGDKIMGTFIEDVAVTVLGAAVSGAVDAGVSSAVGRRVYTIPGVVETDTTDLSKLKKHCKQRQKQCVECSVACHQLANCYKSNTSNPETEKRIRDAKKCLGL